MQEKVNHMTDSSNRNKDVAAKRLASFIHDLEEYTFLPTFVRFQPPKNANIKIKTDIFRYPTLLANNIKLCMGLNLSYSWKVYKKLFNQKLLHKDTYQYLTIILGISLYMRVTTYLFYRSQVETAVLEFDHYTYNSMKKPQIPLSPRLFPILVCY